MTWWRHACDEMGRTISDRLNLEIEACQQRYRYSFLVESVDEKFKKVRYAYCRNRSMRIRAILRRLHICPRCKWGVVLSVRRMPSGQVEGYGRMRCPVCGGTGRVKEERRNK